ncbi:cell division protein FtsX [Oceanibacterium hippocampi]|uniref:Cell division ABC transporter subunit FtsX n=1 Tax=Oceanibacterium hippocampi TaxID=745714 RepID=A0A1Y5RVW7_9PROT|nr:hypothetical protein [Oceanibacterium hippocampi]SLN26499.1 cell division ABC transporter subunit FtsX [Oceanibacterium hippocampi]
MARVHELRLERDGSARTLPYLIAVMLFLAALAIAGASSLHGAVGGWQATAESQLTVEIAHRADADMAALEAAAVERLRQIPGVATATALPEAELRRLVSPWFGDDEVTAKLPLPRLIDVRLDAAAGLDPETIAARLAETVPEAHVEDFRPWMAPLVRFARAMQLVALSVFLLIAGATATIVVFATRAGLASQSAVIEVLHLVGAHDAYVARQFERHFLRLTIAGAVPGLVLGVAAALALQGLAAQVDIPLVSGFHIGVAGWIAMALAGPALALLVVATTRYTVISALRRMM